MTTITPVTSTTSSEPIDITPAVQSLVVNGTPLESGNGVYRLPRVVNPGDVLQIEATIRDDQPGALKVFDISDTYAPAPEGTVVEVTVTVPGDLNAPEIPILLRDRQAAVIGFEPGDGWVPWLEIEGWPTAIDMGGTAEFVVTAGDLNGGAVSLDIAQVFTRGPDAVSVPPSASYLANFVLDFQVKETAAGTAVVATPVPLPGHYGMRITVTDRDGNTTETYREIDVDPTVEGILDQQYRLLGAWFKFHPQPDEWRAFEDSIGHDMAIVHADFSSFCTKGCNEMSHLQRILGWIIEANRIPQVSFDFSFWDWDAGASAPSQPSMQDILDGQFDDYLAMYARNLAALDGPILLALGWEFNIITGNDYWRPARGFESRADTLWSAASNLYSDFGDPAKADGPERFVEVWKHACRIFTENGADNVLLVWNPNWISDPKEPWNFLENYWPGEEYVDVIGPSVYNYQNENRSFDSLWDEELSGFVDSHPETPVIIRELGSDARGNRALWHAETLSQIAGYPAIRGVVFFSEDMGGLYNFHTDPARTEAIEAELDTGNFGFSE